MPMPIFSRSGGFDRRLVRMSDAELIAACLDGEASAWDALVDRYKAVIYAVLRRMKVPEADAEDLFHDVCLLLLHHLEDLRDTTRLAGWLVTTTKRELWRLQRRRKTVLASEMDDQQWQMESAQSITVSAQSSPEEMLISLEQQHQMRQAMQRLPDRCRHLLLLLYAQTPPCSYTEAAQRLALPLGSIGPSRARCLEKLHKILQEIDF